MSTQVISQNVFIDLWMCGGGLDITERHPWWARGKWRGFSPGAAARHSQHARVHTEFPQKHVFFPFPDFSPFAPGLKSGFRDISRLKSNWKKKTNL